MIYSELLSRTSQQLTTDLADRKQHYDSLFAILIPPELQQLQSSICEILHFIQQVMNGVLQLQRDNNGQYFLFLLSWTGGFTEASYIAARPQAIQQWLSPLEPQHRHQVI